MPKRNSGSPRLFLNSPHSQDWITCVTTRLYSSFSVSVISLKSICILYWFAALIDRSVYKLVLDPIVQKLQIYARMCAYGKSKTPYCDRTCTDNNSSTY